MSGGAGIQKVLVNNRGTKDFLVCLLPSELPDSSHRDVRRERGVAPRDAPVRRDGLRRAARDGALVAREHDLGAEARTSKLNTSDQRVYDDINSSSRDSDENLQCDTTCAVSVLPGEVPVDAPVAVERLRPRAL